MKKPRKMPLPKRLTDKQKVGSEIPVSEERERLRDGSIVIYLGRPVESASFEVPPHSDTVQHVNALLSAIFRHAYAATEFTMNSNRDGGEPHGRKIVLLRTQLYRVSLGKPNPKPKERQDLDSAIQDFLLGQYQFARPNDGSPGWLLSKGEFLGAVFPERWAESRELIMSAV